MARPDNAVALVAHLRQQGKSASEAVDHAAQQFGIERKTLMTRVNGYVADHTETMEALSRARDFLTTVEGIEGWPARDLVELLTDLYVAVTGEAL